MHKGGGYIKSLFMTILSAFGIVIIAYVFYNVVIIGGAFEGSAIVRVATNVWNWGMGVAISIGDFIISMFPKGQGVVE